MSVPTELDSIAKRLGADQLWKMGLDGNGVRVAVLDSGIDKSILNGRIPIFEQDFTGENFVGDRKNHHGSLVANCVRRIAPRCDLLNFKVVPLRGTTSKKKIANILRQLGDQQEVDIINISLDFDATGCIPTFEVQTNPFRVPPIVRSSMCELCLACWDLAEAGIAVVAAAGNRWGKIIQCPGRCPGVLCATGTIPGTIWYDVYESKSKLRRWWEWHFTGQAGRLFGTSFSAGHMSGELALLAPWIKKHGWLEARDRLLSINDGTKTLTAIQAHDSLVFDSDETQKLSSFLEQAIQVGSLAGHLLMVEELNGARGVEPKHVPSSMRRKVAEYLTFLRKAIDDMESDPKKLFENAGIEKVLQIWLSE